MNERYQNHSSTQFPVAGYLQPTRQCTKKSPSTRHGRSAKTASTSRPWTTCSTLRTSSPSTASWTSPPARRSARNGCPVRGTPQTISPWWPTSSSSRAASLMRDREAFAGVSSGSFSLLTSLRASPIRPDSVDDVIRRGLLRNGTPFVLKSPYFRTPFKNQLLHQCSKTFCRIYTCPFHTELLLVITTVPFKTGAYRLVVLQYLLNNPLFIALLKTKLIVGTSNTNHGSLSVICEKKKNQINDILIRISCFIKQSFTPHYPMKGDKKHSNSLRRYILLGKEITQICSRYNWL